MLDALFDKFVQMVIRSAEPKEVEAGDARKDVYFVDGKLQEIPYRNERDHTARGLEEVVRLAARFTDEGHEPVVWYDQDAVKLVINDEADRQDVVTMTLHKTQVFMRLMELTIRGCRAFDQQEFIRLLRVDLAGALDPVVLLQPVRKLRFTNSQQVSSERRSQAESLGKEITNRVESDGGDLPETVTLRTAVYTNPGANQHVNVECAVEVLPATNQFRLTPLPDELDRVTQLVMGAVAEKLAADLPDAVPHYYGRS